MLEEFREGVGKLKEMWSGGASLGLEMGSRFEASKEIGCKRNSVRKDVEIGRDLMCSKSCKETD